MRGTRRYDAWHYEVGRTFTTIRGPSTQSTSRGRSASCVQPDTAGALGRNGWRALSSDAAMRDWREQSGEGGGEPWLPAAGAQLAGQGRRAILRTRHVPGRRDRRPAPLHQLPCRGQARRIRTPGADVRHLRRTDPAHRRAGRPHLRTAAWRAVWGAVKSNPVYADRYRHLTTRETNKLKPTQAQTVLAGAILRQLHAVVTTGQALGSRHRHPRRPTQADDAHGGDLRLSRRVARHKSWVGASLPRR